MKELKYIRTIRTSEGKSYTIDNVLNIEDYFSLLENEPNFERRIVIIAVVLDEFKEMKVLADKENVRKYLLKYVDEMKVLKKICNADMFLDIEDLGKLDEMIIRYNRQNNIDEILGADTNSREE